MLTLNKHLLNDLGTIVNFAFNFMRINFYSPRNHLKTYSFLMISGGIEVN